EGRSRPREPSRPPPARRRRRGTQRDVHGRGRAPAQSALARVRRRCVAVGVRGGSSPPRIRAVLTVRSPPPVIRRGTLSPPEPSAVGAGGDGRGVMTTTKTESVPNLGPEAGMRHAFLVYGPELRSYAARRLGNRLSAEDAVQETLLRAWKHADGFDPSRGTV